MKHLELGAEMKARAQAVWVLSSDKPPKAASRTPKLATTQHSKHAAVSAQIGLEVERSIILVLRTWHALELFVLKVLLG